MIVGEQRIYFDQNSQANVDHSWLFLDNGVLNDVFQSADLLQALVKIFPKSQIILDETIRLEFLRSTYLPDLRRAKEAFIQDHDYLLEES